MSRQWTLATALAVFSAAAYGSVAAAADDHAPAGTEVAPVNQAASLSVRWTRRLTGLPFKVWETNLAYDPIANRVVNHGGHVLGGPGRHNYPQSSYTYTYDPESNLLRRSSAPYRPQRRCLVDLTWADSIERVVTGNGRSDHGSLPQGKPSSDWRSIIKGDPVGPWLYDGRADTWENSRTRGEPWRTTPHAQLAYDPAHDAVVYLGGKKVRIYYPYRNINRSFDVPQPLRYRKSYGIAALGRSGKILVFGGTHSDWNGALDDSWIYDVGSNTWQEVTGSVRPPPGMPYTDFLKLNLVFDSEISRALLLTVPYDTRPPCFNQWQPPQLWSFEPDSHAWSPVPVAGADRPHYPGIMAWGEGQLVLAGGGRDGASPDGSCDKPNPRPSQSRQLWTGRIDAPESLQAPAFDPDSLSLTTTAGGSGPELSWTASPDASYEVWRAALQFSWQDPLIGGYSKVATVSGGSWSDPDVPADAAFAYRVVRSGLGLAYGSLPAFNQPRRPHGMVASVETASRVALHWAASTEPDVVGYNVYRKHGGGSTDRINAAPVTGTSFVDTAAGLDDGVLSSYYVRAVNQAGMESGASPLAYTAPDAPRQFSVCLNSAGDKAIVRWHWPVNRGASGFKVYFNDHHENTNGYTPEQRAAWWAQWQPVTAEPIAAHEIEVDLPDPSKDHYFYGRAVNALGQEGFFTDIASATDNRFLSATASDPDACDTIYRDDFKQP